MTQVNFVGSATLAAMQKQPQQKPTNQKLAQIVAQKADDRYKEIYNKTIEFLIANITENAVKREYTFDLKKFIGDKFKIECSESLYTEIQQWLADEGFNFDTQRNKTNTEIEQRWCWSKYDIAPPPKNRNQPYSNMTFFINW